MSVYYESFIGFGWILDDEEVTEMNITSNCEFEDSFISLNAYSGNLYFFGEKLSSIEPGECQRINNTLNEQALQYVIKSRRYILEKCNRVDLLDETPTRCPQFIW